MAEVQLDATSAAVGERSAAPVEAVEAGSLPASPIHLLEALTQPIGAAAFGARYWPRRPFVGHGALERLRGLGEIEALASVEALLGAASGPVRVWSPRDRQEGTRAVPPPQALEAYRRGWTVYLNGAERFAAELIPFVRRLEVELGLGYGAVVAEAFASRAAAGARAHCDFDFGFSVQLHGRKRWQLAPNESFRDPHESVLLCEHWDASVARYARGAPPREMPREGRLELVAEPGTVVFLPRGHWHATQADEPSLSLTFACKEVPWAALVSRHLEAELRQLDEWRAFPCASQRVGRADRAQRVATLAGLLETLGAVVSNLSAEHLVGEWSRPPVPLFQRGRASQPTYVEAPDAGSEPLVRLRQPGGRLRLLQIPREHDRLVRWVMAATFPIAAPDLAALAGCTVVDAEAALAALVGEGVLEAS